VKESVLALYRERYWDFGPTLASEKLFEREGYQVDHETLRRWLMDSGKAQETPQVSETTGAKSPLRRVDSDGRESS
jgi:hypothetical protein